jgi:hypothetical protein
MKTNSRGFIERNFPELRKYKRSTSRKWESSEKPHYKNNWWFKCLREELEENEFIIFAGANDQQDKDFKVLKVPTAYLLSNLDKLDMTEAGWINLYIHMESLEDVRNDARLPFKQFALN